jgi:hypothetical protein
MDKYKCTVHLTFSGYIEACRAWEAEHIIRENIEDRADKADSIMQVNVDHMTDLTSLKVAAVEVGYC